MTTTTRNTATLDLTNERAAWLASIVFDVEWEEYRVTLRRDAVHLRHCYHTDDLDDAIGSAVLMLREESDDGASLVRFAKGTKAARAAFNACRITA